MDNRKPDLWTWFKESIIALFIVFAMCYVPATQAEVTFDGSMGAPGTLQGPNMEITADRGQIDGNNLFHSFSQFNVYQGETANFSGPANVQNILGRVTGGDPSTIDGTISSSISGANLFLMNPHGIMFGPNAQINITGSFHATTADYLKLGNNERFYADLTQNTTLSIASPAAFGFLDSSVADISVNGSQMSVIGGNTISLVGGDISFVGANVSVTDGQINLANSHSNSEIAVNPDQTDAQTLDDVGTILLTNGSVLDTSGPSSGKIVIRGGNLVVDNMSNIASDVYGTNSTEGPGIDIVTPGNVTVRGGSNLHTNAIVDTADSRGVSIAAENITISNQSSVQSNTESSSQANSGNIDIYSNNNTTIEQGSYVVTTNDGEGNAGAIDIESGNDTTISSASFVYSGSFSGTNIGDAGAINIRSGKDINIEGLDTSLDPYSEYFTGVAMTTGYNSNPTEKISLRANGDINLSNFANIYTYNKGASQSGNISLSSQKNINLMSGTNISTLGDNYTGNINLYSNGKVTINGVYENSNPYSSGIFSQLDYSNGFSGDILIEAKGDIEILDGALIKTAVFNGNGTGGNIIIKSGGEFKLDGFNEYFRDSLINQDVLNRRPPDIVSATYASTSQIVTQISSGNTNQEETSNISIYASSIVLSNGGNINSSTLGVSKGGDIVLDAQNKLLIENGSAIISSSSGAALEEAGNAGKIKLTANSINITGNKHSILPTGVFSESSQNSTGNGGDIEVSTNILRLADYAKISGETLGIGNGGDITIDTANSILLTRQSSITTSSTSDTNNGNAGNIFVDTGLLALNGSSIQTTAIAGNGGDINISAHELVITNDSMIDASSEQAIDGTINITTRGELQDNIAELPESAIDVAKLFKNECGVISNSSRFSANLIQHNYPILLQPASNYSIDNDILDTNNKSYSHYFYRDSNYGLNQFNDQTIGATNSHCTTSLIFN